MAKNVNYEAFFNAITGFAPFPYQSAFHRRDRTHPTCTLSAPTGLGKTEAITVDWLYGILYDRSNTPTRLVITLPMRSLTHQTATRVQGILKKLSDHERFGNERFGNKIDVYVLVGGTGAPPDRTWLNNIDRPCIIIGTQDQILSRQLFRGYGCSRWEWPLHGALLNNDVRIVADETQLMGVGYRTTALLQKMRQEQGTYGHSELILCSATLDLRPLTGNLKYSECKISDDDYTHPIASLKLGMEKVFHRVEISLAAIADKVITEHISNTLSLVILNKVDDAITIAHSIGQDLPVLLLHSRFRGGDRARLSEKLQDFTGVVVATQVIEAGIDLDARKLFTVACPWASFVQRCGRAGRNGTYVECDVYLLDLDEMRSSTKPLPYTAQEISEFYDRVDQLPSAGIKDLMTVPPPPQNNGKHHLKLSHLHGLFDNHPGNGGDPVGHFIREDIDISIKLLWRDNVVNVAPTMPPSELEAINLRASTATKFLASLKNYWRWDNKTETWITGIALSDECYICCDRTVGGYSESLGFTGNPQDIPPVLRLSPKETQNMQWSKSQDVTLTMHSIDAQGFARQICQTLNDVMDDASSALVTRAAHLHDWGKAHPQFQAACAAPGEIWAKRHSGFGHYTRPGFRHELASAIALLIHDEAASFDLAYIIAAHHGKCRMQIANFDFIPNQVGLRGLQPGDVLPAVDLGDGETMPSVTLEALPPQAWHQHAQDLLDQRGPFVLSFLETIVRVADWRASELRTLMDQSVESSGSNSLEKASRRF
ncbi:MAG: DEAD/DEAH box helicase [Synechococcales bacterium]|nr:DEAD/DEAH box helicase [Synechococcales bacterium]